MFPKRRDSLIKNVLWFCAAVQLSTAIQSAIHSTNEADGKLQVPTWSPEDLQFFLHGSMSTEFLPETVFRAFMRAYPDLFASPDLSHLGLIPDATFGWPIGFSRASVSHLGGLSSVGINCAACHVGEVSAGEGHQVRVLGMTSLFDAEAFFGQVLGSTFRTADPANMKKFLIEYLMANDPESTSADRENLENKWTQQEQRIKAVFESEPRELVAGKLYEIAPLDLRLDRRALAGEMDLAMLTRTFLKLFHNMRAALHVPDQPPTSLPPASGPGRNDAFGLLSAVFFGAPQPFAPVKYGLVWNLKKRHWVHWDGNTQSPIGRNLLASLGLGAPLLEHHGQLNFALVNRHTELSEHIQPPQYPWAIDRVAADRGKGHYQALCASCHDSPEGDARLYAIAEIHTDPRRAELFNQVQADRFNKFLMDLETPGYVPSKEPGIRSTGGKYWASTLAGVWARSPYLHNGSVRTMNELLTPAAQRAKSFHRGSKSYEATQMGYTDAGSYILETSNAGNSNTGHEYGTDLSAAQKNDLIEYLKTL